MKTVLITGISGFAGSFLAEHLITSPALAGEVKIIGISNSTSSPNLSAIEKQIRLEHFDLMDTLAVRSLIASVKPEEIYHLAALTAPAKSFDNPSETINNNITAQLNIFEAVRLENIGNIKILITSSADIYGLVSAEDLPVDENTGFMPTNPYAVSKIAQDFLALQYYLTYKIPVVRARPFNHIGPRQSPAFVVAKFAKKIAEIEKGLTSAVLQVGSLDSKRDFTDVRDMVRAYVALMENGVSGEAYNIGSGISRKISDILDMLLSQSSVRINIEIDSSLLRPADNPDLLCNGSKMQAITGWKPEISLESTLKDTLDYWRGIV